jgi:hypothetical protein
MVEARHLDRYLTLIEQARERGRADRSPARLARVAQRSRVIGGRLPIDRPTW